MIIRKSRGWAGLEAWLLFFTSSFGPHSLLVPTYHHRQGCFSPTIQLRIYDHSKHTLSSVWDWQCLQRLCNSFDFEEIYSLFASFPVTTHKLFDKWFRETRQTQAFWERFCFSPQFRQGKCMMVSASRHNAVLTLSSRRSKAAFKGTASFYSVLGAPVGRLYEGVFHKLPITQTQHCHHVLLFSLFIVYTSLVNCTWKTVTSVLPFLLAESKVRGNAKKGRF